MGTEREVVGENAYEALIRRTYQDFESRDLDLLRVVMAEDVVRHEPGRSRLAGDYKGPEAVLGLLGALKSGSGGTFKIEVLDVFSKPERVVALQRETAARNQRSWMSLRRLSSRSITSRSPRSPSIRLTLTSSTILGPTRYSVSAAATTMPEQPISRRYVNYHKGPREG